ncbi:UPF0183-domain-containing protein [Piedraia hortae CBS 480.64]|uniref:UPF0183-domain-containing protein n=1 Tax=Piedraia hortae CBS 480.64 TaxID=1314780 RepID=A0A6A7C8E3_9PEZI|nr:UPF0183-domain-containing protein [Piedraia hortae CBS 480.64]
MAEDQLVTTSASFPILPGASLGPFVLGANLRDVLTIAKSDKSKFPKLEVYYSSVKPLTTVVVVSLPSNGLRLQFDGPNQLLRLIEVTELDKIKLLYKGSELLKTSSGVVQSKGPPFRKVYSLFGPSYPGEYLPPSDGSGIGTYVLSWQGVAFNFPLQHSAWSPKKDHVALLSSNIAPPASNMALFEGSSWAEARRDLFTKPIQGPRSYSSVRENKDCLPGEIEKAQVDLTNGTITLVRYAPHGAFTIVPQQTTPQDLITELGAPETTHAPQERTAKSEREDSKPRTRSISAGRPHIGSVPSSYSSTGTETFDADFDNLNLEPDPADRAARDRWWNYYNHGMDILVGLPSGNTMSNGENDSHATPLSQSPHAVVLRVVIHGNVPGSYTFNRHRRLRWTFTLPEGQITSEQNFDRHVKPHLVQYFANGREEAEMMRGKVVNRTWSVNEPTDSSFFLLEGDQDITEEDSNNEQWLGNTKLYAFATRLQVEVLANSCIAALTVS